MERSCLWGKVIAMMATIRSMPKTSPLALFSGIPRLDRPLTHWRHVRRETRRLTQTLKQGRRPVVIYSHPKTASTSVTAAVNGCVDCDAFHCHSLRKCHFTRKFEPHTTPLPSGMQLMSEATQWPLQRMLVDSDHDIRCITLVRDPIATQASWLFYGLQRWLNSNHAIDSTSMTVGQWSDVLDHRFPQSGLYAWWDHEFRAVTKLDIRDGWFDAQQGFGIQRHGRMHSLVLSTDLDDAAKRAVLQEYLQCDVPVIARSNRSSDRAGEISYRRAKQAVALHEALCQSMLNHELAQVLYTQSQRQWFEEKWLKIRGTTSERVDGAACIGPSPSDPQSPA